MAAKLIKAETEAMFYYWLETDNLTEVSRRFKHGRSTVRRIAQSGDWQLRRDKIQNKVDEKIAKKIADQMITDFQVTTRLLCKAVDLIEIEGSEIKPTYGDATRLIQVRAELTGGSSGRSGGVNLYQVLSDGSLSTLSEEELGQRLRGHGSFIARKAVLSKTELSSTN